MREQWAKVQESCDTGVRHMNPLTQADEAGIPVEITRGQALHYLHVFKATMELMYKRVDDLLEVCIRILHSHIDLIREERAVREEEGNGYEVYYMDSRLQRNLDVVEYLAGMRGSVERSKSFYKAWMERQEDAMHQHEGVWDELVFAEWDGYKDYVNGLTEFRAGLEWLMTKI